MNDIWAVPDWGDVGLLVASAIGIFAGVIAVVRIVGLRAFSKMSSFDFAITVAMGSLVASVATGTAPLLHGLLAVATLLGTQWLVARCRRWTRLERVVDNRPLLLMDGPRMIDRHLDRARITSRDILAKLREANVTDLDEVLAVVLETTGDISVLSGDDALDERLLAGVGGLDARTG